MGPGRSRSQCSAAYSPDACFKQENPIITSLAAEPCSSLFVAPWDLMSGAKEGYLCSSIDVVANFSGFGS